MHAFSRASYISRSTPEFQLRVVKSSFSLPCKTMIQHPGPRVGHKIKKKSQPSVAFQIWPPSRESREEQVGSGPMSPLNAFLPRTEISLTEHGGAPAAGPDPLELLKPARFFLGTLRQYMKRAPQGSFGAMVWGVPRWNVLMFANEKLLLSAGHAKFYSMGQNCPHCSGPSRWLNLTRGFLVLD